MNTSQAPESISKDKNNGVARNAGIVSFYTMLSRIMGLVRDVIFAHFFGASHATDAFLMAFTIPNTFRMLVAEGTLTVAFLPVFNETQRTQGDKAAKIMMRQAIAVFPSLTAVLTALCMVYAESLVTMFANGYHAVPGKFELTVFLTRWMFPYLALVSFVALAMGALNAKKKFASSAASPMLFNIIHIICMVTLGLWIEPHMLGVGLGVLLGGFAQVILQLLALWRVGLLVRPQFIVGPEIKRVLKLMLPAILALGVYQINILILRYFASYLGEAAVTYLYNADRFLQLPLGVFGIAIATAALPTFSDAHADRDIPRLVNAFTHAIRLTNFITVPASAGLAILALPIISTTLQHGAYSYPMTQATSNVLFSFSLGLVAISAIRVVAKVFFSMQEFRIPVVCSAVGMLFNVGFAPVLATRLGISGLALSVSLSAWAQLIIQVIFLHLRLGQIQLKRILLGLLRDCFASGIMLGVVYYLIPIGNWENGVTVWNIMSLFVIIGCGSAVFILCELLMRAPELQILIQIFYRKIGRKHTSQ